MLDDLLGRTELKARIDDLEAEADSLQQQLDAEADRRSEAARKRQAAERRANELETKIEELQDRLDRTDSGDAAPEFRDRIALTGRRRDRVLALLESLDAGPEGVLTAYVADDPPARLRDALGDRAPLVARAAPCLVVHDRDGIVSTALRPPNPPEPFCEWGQTARIERDWLAPTGRYALAVVRADLFAVGVYRDGDRRSFDGFTSNVKSDHSKGGFSQARFERLRDEQIQAHLEECQRALADIDADRLFVVGQDTLLDAFDAAATAAVDATGDPADALADAHTDFWTLPLSLL
ncbi:Vms1/Ankzf1 family peptidyl-tRNA hydrolase [Halobacterium sp. BOL4-2]|uniref:Vms1/Ankzf1 family peptidyl-tRNA hydrolase n=1 Tax=unclassified Halobacterium TaxID=2668073 RepID=UPI0019660864|nr:Vms1/Ankzf1 family peptidyl-tRNA hydrolase [Halobacterium sp. BOL4-2]QRY24189.1 hypothetical protein JRZ79_07155 [Halobacterium sp. BOL4-2]